MGAQVEGHVWEPTGNLKPELVEAEAGRPFALYVHVPFCTTRCGYCDFNTYTAQFGDGADTATYANSVVKEIDLSQRVLDQVGLGGRAASSIFFGGGTPSLLAPQAIDTMLGRIRDTHGIGPDAEVTLEANPEDVTDEKVRAWKDSGVTRVSMGMQSASPRILKVLDRQHRPETVPVALARLKEAGLQTSLDLIYGTPTETLREWEQSVQAVIDLDPGHVSAYSLIVEEGTKMAAQIARGTLPETDPDLDAEKYVFVSDALGDAGYSWYEISNFAKTDQLRSKHNLAYWRDWDWWGFGPGAHSHIGKMRWWNVKHPLAYAGRLNANTSPGFQGEFLTQDERRTEAVMLGIRTREGLSATVASPSTTKRLVEEALVGPEALQRGRLVLTQKGRLLADYVTRLLLGWE